MDEFAGKVAIVTGATRGIGRATAWRLAEAGAAVAICSRDAEAVAATVAEAEADGLYIDGMAVDLARAGERRAR